MRFFFFISLLFLLSLTSCSEYRELISQNKQEYQLILSELDAKRDSLINLNVSVDSNAFGGNTDIQEQLIEIEKEYEAAKDEYKHNKKTIRKYKNIDQDQDGVLYVFDIEPNFDQDGDGVPDSLDMCPYSNSINVDEFGCEIAPTVGASNLVILDLPDHFITSIDEVDSEELRNMFKEEGYTVQEINIYILKDMIDKNLIDFEQYEEYKAIIESGGIPNLAVPMPTKAWIPNIENMEIIDKADDDSTSSTGTIAYSVPSEMKVGQEYKITLRITKQKGSAVERTLILGDREIPISDTNINSKIFIENIRVERSMSAELLSEDGAFKITPLNTEKNQIVEDESYTEWGWVIVPLKSGTSYLKMIIKIKIVADGETNYKEIVVFDKNIEVKSNVKLEVKSWLGQYWQWLMTTIIIPLVVFFYKKKQADKKKKKGEDA